MLQAAESPPPELLSGEESSLERAIGIIAGRVEQLRGEPFDRAPIAVRVRDDMLTVAAEIRAFNAIPRERLAARGRAWADLGLSDPGAPERLLKALAVDLAGIGFDPEGNRLLVSPELLTKEDYAPTDEAEDSSTVLLMTGIRPDEPLVGHLLTHVRQRERGGGDYLAETTDQLLAQAAWAEGEANLVAVRYLFGGMGLADDVVDRSLDPGYLLDGSLMPPYLGDRVGAVGDMLRFVYNEGFAQAATRFRAGGWSAVRTATERARTTRQVLHPAAYPPEPAAWPEPEPPRPGLELVDRDSLGELGLITLISQTTGKDNLALQVGDGWTGDRLYRWEPATVDPGQGATEWLLRWATPEDLDDFDYALARSLARRFPDHELAPAVDGVRVLTTETTRVSVERLSEREVRLLILPRESPLAP